jgi:LPXTG-motif cell wall-anchored protein
MPGDQNVTGADRHDNSTTAAADVNANQASTTSAANDQNANADQSNAAAAGADQNNAADKAALPQTASPLPLLGLLGFGSTAVGAFLRRRK